MFPLVGWSFGRQAGTSPDIRGNQHPGQTDTSGRRSPDRQPLMGTREAEGIYFTSARRIARRPMASGIQSHTIVVTASCCQYSVVMELSKSRVVA